MIPNFDRYGNLPPGIHEAKWAEFVGRFGYTTERSRLIEGLLIGMKSLWQAGCQRIYVDGSFVTAKKAPNDFDVCWDERGVDFDLLNSIDPVILKFDNMRAAQRAKYGGEFFLAGSLANLDGISYLEFFQADRDGNPKGIIAIDPEDAFHDQE